MVTKQTWDDFRSAGLLWWINRILHTFGWALVVEVDTYTDKVTNVYPARCKFRGFCEDSESKGFSNLHKYLKDNIEELQKETEDNK